MAAIRISESKLVCISAENIITFPLQGGDVHVYKSDKPEFPKERDKHHPKGNEDGTGRVLASGFSHSGQYFITCDDYKQVTTWRTKQDGPWQKISTRTWFRRPMALAFTKDDRAVLVADKSGDVYSFSISNPDKNGELLLGHLSMLLDLVLCDDDRLLVTCDRDEKIRVSHHPNAFSIHSYCLGHTDYVGRLVYIKEEDVMVSGSGDGTIRLWNYKTGQEIHQINCQDHIKEDLIQKTLGYSSPTDHNISHDDQHDNNERAQGKEIEVHEGDMKKSNDSKCTENTALDLKCLACCQKQKILAVGFDRVSVVLLYKYQAQSPAAANKMNLTFLQAISLQGVLWDLTFDLKGHLWVLLADESSPLVVFHKANCDNETKFVKIDTNAGFDNVMDTVALVKENWQLLKASLNQDSIFRVMHKVKGDDNFYQERKHQKLEEQKQRYNEKKCERRKRAKQVLPTGESRESNASEVLPSAECIDDNGGPHGKTMKVT